MSDLDRRYLMLPPEDVLYTVSILANKKDYNHKLMNIPYIWKDTRGSSVKVAVLDTGGPSHQDLAPLGNYIAKGIQSEVKDVVGHSTHVAGILAAIADNDVGVDGIAPDVDDYYIKVLDDNGLGSIGSIVDGIYKAADDLGVDVINMSLGMHGSAPRSKELEEACNYAVDQGVAVFAAAGNDSWSVSQPAVFDSVMAVGAINKRKRKASFSNFGPQVDFVAGGVDVYSTHLNNRYARLSGTSMACPALCAVGCLILARHIAKGEKLTPQALKDHIKKISIDLGTAGRDDSFGDGLPVFNNEAKQNEGFIGRLRGFFSSIW